MKRNYRLLNCILILTAVCILLPALVLLVWSFVGRWPWPGMVPEVFTTRTWQELLFGSASLPRLLASSISLAGCVALLGTLIGLLTARATELYDFPGKNLVRFGSFLPLLIPGTVFAMGIQVILIKLGLTDTVPGVVLVHLIAALPYCITIMTDVTQALGDALEQQAAVLGASPLRAFLTGSLPGLLPGVLSSISMAFVISYSQFFTTLIVGGGRVKTIALVLVPYIQSGDRALASAYSVAFILSALVVFALFEGLIHKLQKGDPEK